jgi:hypothetical protein
MRDVQQDLDLDLYSKDATRYDENYSHSTVLASTFLFQLIGDQSWRRTVEVKVRYIVWLPLYDMGNTQF